MLPLVLARIGKLTPLRRSSLKRSFRLTDLDAFCGTNEAYKCKVLRGADRTKSQSGPPFFNQGTVRPKLAPGAALSFSWTSLPSPLREGPMRYQSELYRKTLSTAATSAPPCKLCQTESVPFDVVDFAKFCSGDPYSNGFAGIPVYYYRCPACDCTFTDFFDTWSPDDFASLVYNDDYVLVDPEYVSVRPEATAREWSIRFDMTKGAAILDYGAGSGGLAERMNAQGYNFCSYDPFSSPEQPDGPFDIVTAFEVIEHSPRPIDTFEHILSMMGERKIVLVGQSTQPDDIMTLRGSWWYIAPRNGHCTTFSERTFRLMAERHGLTYFPASGLHGFFSHPDDELSRAVIPRVVNWG